MGFSIGKALGSVAKVAAAPFTAGASLSGGSLSDMFKNGASNVSAGILSGVSGGDTSSLLSNIVQGAIGIGTDYLQNQLNLDQKKDLAAYTAARQNELNEAAFQRNLQQWNLENEYNSPAAQMQRFADAGLNPNLIYGQNNYSASSPELKPATYDPGEYQPVDHSAQRQALKIAMLEHAQRIENQAIQNDLARQRLVLAEAANRRADLLADSLVTSRKSSGKGKNPVDKPMSTPGKIVHDIGYYWDAMKQALGVGNGVSADLF